MAPNTTPYTAPYTASYTVRVYINLYTVHIWFPYLASYTYDRYTGRIGHRVRISCIHIRKINIAVYGSYTVR